ncbi:MAG: AraC family ligand binding domain-containing protein [Dysgonamonadaceae bacterium]|nr:AraC family ligand binding domain-containing protein [Dysgonamonadaceae bacterium]
MRHEKTDFISGLPLRIYLRAVEQYPYHWHDTLEIILVLEGTVGIVIGDQELRLCENDIAIINLGELHRIIKNQDKNKILFIQIDPDFYKNILPDNGYIFIYCCATYHEAHAPEKYKKLREYISSLVNAFIENSHKCDRNNIAKDLSGKSIRRGHNISIVCFLFVNILI